MLSVVFVDFCCVMKVDLYALQSLWLLTFFWTWSFIGNLIELFFCKSCHWNCFYYAMRWVFGCTLASCFSISFWNFLHSCNVKTVPCQMWICVCFLFPSKEVINFFIDCSNDTGADEEHGVANCNVRVWSFSLCCNSVFATCLWLVVFT